MSRFSFQRLKCQSCRREGHWYLLLKLANVDIRACKHCGQPVYLKSLVDSMPSKDPGVLRVWDEVRI
jgi:hypothetical protein